MKAGAAICWDVFEEHLDEAAFLWTSWENALRSAELSPQQVASGTEQRLFAHLHALSLGGPAVAKRLLYPALAGSDADQIFPAAFALLSLGDLKKVLGALEAADEETTPALVRALELHDEPRIAPQLLALGAKGTPAVRAAALEVLAFRGVDPGENLRLAAETRDPTVIAAAAKAARNAPALHARPFILGALTSAEPSVRDAAIETGLMLGLRDAWGACRGVLGRKPVSPTTWLLWALGGGDIEQQELVTDLRSPKPSLAAIWAAGFSGRRALADACIAAMSVADPRTARLAGEAFSAISGLRIQGQYLAQPPAEPDEPIPFEKEDLSADLIPKAEDALPLPEAWAVEAWWNEKRGGFDSATRYLDGKPITPESIRQVLERGPMRRRSVLALDLAIRSRGAVRLETRRWVRDQRVSLEGFRASRLAQPFGELAKEI